MAYQSETQFLFGFNANCLRSHFRAHQIGHVNNVATERSNVEMEIERTFDAKVEPFA